MKGYADALFDAYRKTPGKPAIFTFDNPEAMKGWSHTPELATELRPGFVRLLGRGGDAKIYRAITLPAGEYREAYAAMDREMEEELEAAAQKGESAL